MNVIIKPKTHYFRNVMDFMRKCPRNSKIELTVGQFEHFYKEEFLQDKLVDHLRSFMNIGIVLNKYTYCSCTKCLRK